MGYEYKILRGVENFVERELNDTYKYWEVLFFVPFKLSDGTVQIYVLLRRLTETI